MEFSNTDPSASYPTTTAGFRVFSNSRRHLLKVFALVLAALSWSPDTYSAPRYYQVDVIAFQHQQPNPALAERFDRPPALQPTPADFQLVNGVPGAGEVALISGPTPVLARQRNTLDASGAYRVLENYSWTVGLEDGQTKSFSIPEIYDLEGQTSITGQFAIRLSRYLHFTPDFRLTEWQLAEEDTMDRLFSEIGDKNNPSAPERSQQNAFGVQLNSIPEEGDEAILQDGSAHGYDSRVEESRPAVTEGPNVALNTEHTIKEQEGLDKDTSGDAELHSNLATHLFPPNNPLSMNGFSPTTYYVLNQKRRMRSKELHYIDHPVLGLLVIFTPIES